MIVDTSVIYALLDRSDNNHAAVARWYRSTIPAFTTTPPILAEVDHLAGARAGRVAQQAWREDLSHGVYDVAWWPGAEREAAAIAERYGDLRVGLADASLVALADRLGTEDIATLDERHFRVMRTAAGKPFRILPRDV